MNSSGVTYFLYNVKKHNYRLLFLLKNQAEETQVGVLGERK